MLTTLEWILSNPAFSLLRQNKETGLPYIRPRQIATEEIVKRVETENWDEIGIYRASGDCICLVCGRKYYDHPEIEPPYEYLTYLCNGDIVKL